MEKINVRQLKADILKIETALKETKKKLRTKGLSTEAYSSLVTWRDHRTLKDQKETATSLYCLRAMCRKVPRLHLHIRKDETREQALKRQEETYGMARISYRLGEEPVALAV